MSAQYLVSARKYRPQTFDTVVGQEHITTTLKNAIRTNHLAHAFLFCGPRGVGKTTCARILAKTINCETPTPDMEACGTCLSCRAFQENTSFNIFELDAASNNSVDDIRELVNGVRFAPQQGRYKIYIIDEVHMLSAAAFNAFLKTLEEPPPYAIFILATTEKHKILPTILSRCQIFDFKRITTSDTVHHLQAIASREGLQAEEAALHVIAQKSEGCMRDSLSMLDRIASFTGGQISYSSTMEHLAMLDADFYFRLTDAMLSQDITGALLQLDAVLEKGFEGNVVVDGLSEHFRNLLLCKDQRMAKMLDVPAEHKRLFFDKAQQAPPSFILSALNVLNDCSLKYRDATNKRLHTELCLIRLCYLQQATSAAPVFDTGDVKKNSSPEPGMMPPPQHYAAPTPQPQQAPPEPQQQQPPTSWSPVPQEQNWAKPQEQAVQQQPAQAPPVQQQQQQQQQQQAPPAQQPPNPPAPERTPADAAPQPDGRRINKSFMDNLDDLLDEDAPEAEELRAMCQEDAERLFAAFREKAKDEGREVIQVQILMMQIECVSEDEVRIVSPTAITDSYAQNMRNDLIGFFSEAMGRRVRVTSELREDENARSAMPVVKSKQEVFDDMVQKNPQIGYLREGLGLQLDF